MHRKVVMLILLAAAIQLSLEVVPVDHYLETQADRDAALASSVKCGGLAPSERDTCEVELAERFASGAAEPARLLRGHCTRFAANWSQAPEAPAACVERFGGWLPSGEAASLLAVSAPPPGR